VIRVAIVVESARLRGELAELLRESSRIELLSGSRETGPDDPADVVLTDAAMESPDSAVVILSDEDLPLATLRSAHGGFAQLPANAPGEQILAAIEAAAAGLAVLHPDHVGLLAPLATEDVLTPREREVLQILGAGLGNREIAARLGISEHTAKFHVSQILAKLNAATRAEAVSIAIRRGLVPL
jgi:two-component system, NarL family, response regulator YdfI